MRIHIKLVFRTYTKAWKLFKGLIIFKYIETIAQIVEIRNQMNILKRQNNFGAKTYPYIETTGKN